MKTLIAYFSRKGDNYVGGKIVNLPVGNTEVAAKKIAELTEIKHFLQSLITEDDHQSADCKAMAQLKAY